MFEKEFIKTLIDKIEKAALEKNTDFFCTMRDIFQARLDSYVARTSNYLASAAVKDCKSDLEALTTAFTEHLSGRAPEQRGNGLKFVCETVKEKGWSLYFQSGEAYCIIKDGEERYGNTDFSIIGCLAVLKLRG